MAPPWLADGVADAIEQRRQELGNPTMTQEDVDARKIQGEHFLVIGGYVFNVKHFLQDHPGGQHALLRNLGHDATTAFLRAHGQSAHKRLVEFFCADIVDASPITISSPAMVEVFEDTSSLGRSRSGGSTPPPFKGFSVGDLQLSLGDGSMLTLPPQASSPLAMLAPLPRPESSTTRRERIGEGLAGLGEDVSSKTSTMGKPTPHPGSPPLTAPHGAHPSGGSATSCPFMMMAQAAEVTKPVGAPGFTSPLAPSHGVRPMLFRPATPFLLLVAGLR
ncbi:hypothetical protein T484DRAFT_1784071 [Baffinella frigidus]|nr:hypothetical protein T484DRAFT_1784071 [Cryptophyta sp. CCMP2293]